MPGAARLRSGTALPICLSVAAMGLAPGAHAACTTDSSGAAPVTTCSDTSDGQIPLLTDAAKLIVGKGASLANSDKTSVVVAIPAVAQNAYRTATLVVDGTIRSDSGTAISVSAGPVHSGYFYDLAGTVANITVGSTGRITGVQAITVASTPGNYSGLAGAVIDNAGTISSLAGPAIVTSAVNDNFVRLTNRATGWVGAIKGVVRDLVNHGTIDGGALSAIESIPGSSMHGSEAMTNDGTITSAASVGTIHGVSLSLTNSGTVRNTANGAAIAGSFLTIVNDGTGVIAGQRGITAAYTLDLTNRGTISGTNTVILAQGGGIVTNRGTITGTIDLGAGPIGRPYSTSTYIADGGTIKGDLLFGKGANLLVETGQPLGVSGRIVANGYSTEVVHRRTGSGAATVTLGERLPGGFRDEATQAGADALVTLQAAKTLDGGIYLSGTGQIVNAANASGGVYMDSLASYYASRNILSSFTNAGIVRHVEVSALSQINTGTISDVSSGETAWLDFGSADTIINSGTVANNGTNHALAEVNFSTDDFALTNSGSIIGGVYVFVYGDYHTGPDPRPVGTIVNSGTISITNPDLSAVELTSGGNRDVAFTNTGTVNGGAYLNGVATRLDNAGRIDGTTELQGEISARVINSGAINGAVTLTGQTLSFDNRGTVRGTVDLGRGSGGPGFGTSAYIANGGTIDGDLRLGGDMNLLVETGQPLGVSGRIVTTGNSTQIVHRRTGSATVTLGERLPDGFKLEATEASGDALVTLQAARTLGGDIRVSGSGQIVNRADTAGGVMTDPGQGSYASAGPLASFTNAGAVSRVAVDARTQINTGTISHTASKDRVWYIAGSAHVLANSGTVANNGEGAAIFVVDPSTQDFAFTNSGSITGGIYATLNGDNHRGAAPRPVGRFVNSGTIKTPRAGVSALYVGGIGGRDIAASNTGSISGSTDLDGAAVTLDNAGRFDGGVTARGSVSTTLTNTGTINGAISLIGPSITFSSSGRITGPIYFQATKADVALSGAFAGNIVYAGTGGKLTVANDAAAAPIAFGSIDGFALYTQTGGTATMAGSSHLGDLVLAGGRLTGLAGSAISARSITVAPGATFGSAGTVNSALTVSGVLSPGASPGTMTVNGDVTLTGGSTSLFEITPGVADRLVINGNLAIQPGSTLAIATSRPLVPGTKLSLINVAGGVAGSFDHITGLTGVIKTRRTGLDLLVQFAPISGATPSMAGIVDYLNTVISSETASPALLASLPLLVDENAASSARALQRISPEAYASALQIGAENGLLLADALRTQTEVAPVAGHGFAFGQGLANWRQLDGSMVRGVGETRLNGSGLLGGLGYAWHGVSVAGFIGYLNQRQTIAARAATTRADGIFGGLNLGIVAGPARLGVTVFHDHSDATTDRSLPGATAAGVQGVSRYGLHSWGIDAQAQATRTLGGGWRMTPHLGTSWVRTHRDAVQETADSVFALAVRAAHRTAGFVDGGLRFSGPEESRWSPSLDLTVRYQVHGRSAVAHAGFAGLDESLVTRGGQRQRVAGIAKAGIGYRLRPGMTLFAQGLGETSDGSTRVSSTVGLRAVF